MSNASGGAMAALGEADEKYLASMVSIQRRTPFSLMMM
jgi:hypothetical protein